MRRSKLIYHPLAVLVYSGVGIILYVGLMRRRYPGGDLSHNFFYVLPIIVPFVAFVVDRARNFSNTALIEFAIDTAVVVTAIMRAFGGVPLVSGHALFLTYAMTRPGTRVTRLTAAIVMLQVIYLKLFVWHDLISPITGAALGLLAAFIVRRLPRRATSLPLRPLPDIQ